LAVCLLVLAHAVHARELTLVEAEQAVSRANREVIAARRALEAAGAQIRQADVAPNPVLSFNATDISRNPGLGAGSITQKRIDSVLRLDQLIERGNKRELRVDAARRIETAAQGDVSDTLRQQLLATRLAYVDLQEAQARAVILGETAELYARTLAAAQARLRAGDLASADVARVQIDAERAIAEQRSAQAGLAKARFALSLLMGAETSAEALHAVDGWPGSQSAPLQPGQTTPDEAALQAQVEVRPDVAAARARVEAADRLRDLARSQRTRDVTVGAQFERYPGNLPTNSIGFGFAIPLFTGNDFSGDIQRAEVERSAAQDALDRARAFALHELRLGLAGVRAASERLARYEGALGDAARRSAEAAEFAFSRGATSVLDLLDARRTLRAVQLDALAARAEYARAGHALRAAQTTEPLQ